MPLDQVARQYADTLLAREIEKVTREYQRIDQGIAQRFASNNSLRSGPSISATCDSKGDRIAALAAARQATLLQSYEKAGIPFDDVALDEISREVRQYCETQGNFASGTVRQLVAQSVGDSAPNGLIEQLAAKLSGRAMQAASDLHTELRIKRYEVVLEERKLRHAYAAGLGKTWDVFVCHASEDKEEIVRPLASALQASGLHVWYGETTLKVGDSFRQAIDRGLAASRYGIVVLSHNFFAKKWPQQELDGLFSKEVAGMKIILPVWHKITESEVRVYSPILAGRIAAQSDTDLRVLVKQLREAMGL